MRLPPALRTLIGAPDPQRRALSIQEAAERHQSALLASEEQSVRAMRAAWKIAEGRIERQLAEVVAKLAAAQASGVVVSPARLFQLDRYQSYLATIGKEIRRFGGRASKQIAGRQSKSAAMGVSHAGQLMRKAGVSAGFVRVPVEALTNIVGVLQDGSPLRELFDTLGPGTAAQAAQVFVEEVSSGRNPKEIAARLRDEVGIVGRRAMLIARTESIRAYRTAQSANYKANSDVVTGWEWLCARDKRSCPICIAMDGQEFRHDQILASHPGCRCTAIPNVRNVPRVRDTGEDWLKDQPERVQVRLLGPTRLRLWKDGVSLADMVEDRAHPRWGPSRRLIPLRRLPRPGTIQPLARPVKPKKAVSLNPKPARRPKSTASTRTPQASLAQAITGIPASGDLHDAMMIAISNIEAAFPGIGKIFAGSTLPMKPPSRTGFLGAFNRPASVNPASPWSGTSIEIATRNGLQRHTVEQMADTATHEMGHAIDYWLGINAGLGSNPNHLLRMVSEGHPAFQEFRDVVRASPEYRSLGLMLTSTDKQIAGAGAYYRRYRECFARKIQAVVARRSGSATARVTFETEYRKDEQVFSAVGFPIQIVWSKTTETKLERALLKGFAALGVKVKP